MTTEEMFQLVLGKFTDLENEVKEMRGEIKSPDNKVDTNQAEMNRKFVNLLADVIKELARIECKIDENHMDMVERFANLLADIIVINSKIDTAMEEQRLNRRVTQSAISELQF